MATTTRFKKVLLFMMLVPALSFGQKKSVGIRIVQDQSTMLYDFETNLLLKKKGFKIQVLLENVEGVYVFASIKDSVYRFSEKDTIYDFVYLPMLKLKEDPFNNEKELNISETGWSYWFYDPKVESHPFSRKITHLDGDRIVCTKNIKILYNINDMEQVRMDDVKEPLYLFFVAVAEYDDKGKPVKELIRKKVKIEWTDDD